MKIEKEKLQNDFGRDTYWTRIHFESDNQEEKSTVLICASHEYLWDFFQAKELEEVKLDQWLQGVFEKWQFLGDKIFSKKVYYDVHAITSEGRANGLEFLQKEIQP